MDSRACVCDAPDSAEALLLRLQQLEVARSKEMHAHGELVGTLEREVESRRTQYQDTQLALAKLTTDRVRLDAEHQMLRSKLALESEQHESARVVIARLREELHDSRELKDQELRALNNRIEQQQRKDGEQLVQIAALQARLDALQTDHAHVIAAREKALAALSTQTIESARLSDALSSKQHDADVLTLRVQLLTDELAQSREANTQAQIEIKSLSRAYDRALQTRNRTLAWRQRQIAVASARNFHRALLLEWRSLVLSEQRRSARDLEAQLQAKTARLEAVEQQLRAKLATTRSFLSATRVEVAEFPQRLALLRDEVCQVQLPQLLEHVRAASESCSMALADGEARQRREVDAALKVLATRKAMVEARQRAMLKLLRKTKRLEIGRQAFYAWKNVYLGNIVAQTTHAAMLAQQQLQTMFAIQGSRSLEPTRRGEGSLNQQRELRAEEEEGGRRRGSQSRQRDPPQRFYFTTLALEQHIAQLKKYRVRSLSSSNSSSSIETADRRSSVPPPPVVSSTSASLRRQSGGGLPVASATDADWKRWRRVNSVAIHSRKGPLTASLMLSPTNASTKTRSQRASKPRKRMHSAV